MSESEEGKRSTSTAASDSPQDADNAKTAPDARKHPEVASGDSPPQLGASAYISRAARRLTVIVACLLVAFVVAQLFALRPSTEFKVEISSRSVQLEFLDAGPGYQENIRFASIPSTAIQLENGCLLSAQGASQVAGIVLSPGKFTLTLHPHSQTGGSPNLSIRTPSGAPTALIELSGVENWTYHGNDCGTPRDSVLAKTVVLDLAFPSAANVDPVPVTMLTDGVKPYAGIQSISFFDSEFGAGRSAVLNGRVVDGLERRTVVHGGDQLSIKLDETIGQVSGLQVLPAEIAVEFSGRFETFKAGALHPTELVPTYFDRLNLLVFFIIFSAIFGTVFWFADKLGFMKD